MGAARTTPYTRDSWEEWGSRFGWQFEGLYIDGAEFRFPDETHEQGYGYVSIANAVRADIDRALSEEQSKEG